MNRVLSSMLVIICSASLASCNSLTNQDVGTVSGAVAGGLLGSTIGQGGGQMVAIAAGTLVGAYLGGSIGKHMDDQDRAQMNHALESNNVGQPAYWHNGKTNADYKVTPVKNVTVNGNRYCREYQTTATIGGKQQQMYGKACRQPDGSWKAVS